MWDRKVPVDVEEEGVERFWEGGKEGEAGRELDWWDDKEAGERHVTGVPDELHLCGDFWAD